LPTWQGADNLRMSHIYIYSPSSAIEDKASFQRGVKRLRALGHEVELDADTLSRHQRFAGEDATRIAAIGRAAASGAEIAMISRGGYGLTRLLAGLPYAALESAIASGTDFVGFSDFTALQLAVMAKTGSITWQGPCVGEDFGRVEEPDEIMLACFDDLAQAQGEGVGWRMPRADAVPAQEIHGATLWGGNLTVLTSMLGTPYFPKVRKGVLFLEDVGEHPYRLERMLTQLLHSGVLASQKALVLGQFTGMNVLPNDRGFRLNSVVQWIRSQVDIPVLTGLPMGHVPTKVLLPVGAEVDVMLDGTEVLIAWGHL
jgi:muramoyltetrapeptide carboxypeptidase